MWNMNITLAIDERLIERARKLAQSEGTSLNQMIRDLLEEATGASTPEARLAELERLWAEEPVESSARSWRREDAYDRSVLR